MDETDLRYAYRCLPLTIANAMGWEILLPAKIIAEWNGGTKLSDITIEATIPVLARRAVGHSHFGHGILTFPVGYLFRTDPGVALWARGVPNSPKDGIAPLDGVIETDWLAFTFTMNWQFTRPGRVTFEKDEPFCFITPVEYRALDDVVPEIMPIAEAPELANPVEAFSGARTRFTRALRRMTRTPRNRAGKSGTLRGEAPFGGEQNPHHVSKLAICGAGREAEPRPTGLKPVADKDKS